MTVRKTVKAAKKAAPKKATRAVAAPVSTFDKQSIPVPTSIGPIVITLRDAGAQVEGVEPDGVIGELVVVVLDQDARVLREVRDALLKHLTKAQVKTLKTFLAGMRDKAQELLP